MTQPNIFTGDFWQRAITQAVHAIAGAILGPLTSEAIHTFKEIPWEALATSGLIGAIVSLLLSLSGQGIPSTPPASLFNISEPRSQEKHSRDRER
jgi:sugar phosphate permease